MAKQAGYLEKFMVAGRTAGRAGGEEVTLQLISGGRPAGGCHLTKNEALTLAAWLVAVAGDREGFEVVFDAVVRT